METNKIMQILEDWNLWHHDLESGFQRDEYLDLLCSNLTSGQITVITGAWRSGKSYLMRQCAKMLARSGMASPSQTLIINFEDPRFDHLDAALLQDIYETYRAAVQPSGQVWLFLDEIQMVKGWERWVRMAHELKRATIIISGSNGNLLGRELGSALTGRHLNVQVFPFSFQEFLAFRRETTAQDIKPAVFLKEYLTFGGFPEVLQRDQKKELLLTYVNDVIERDLMRRYRIRKEAVLRELVRWYLSNVSSPISYTKLGKWIGATPDTVEKFSGYFEDAYLIFFLKRFSFKVKEQEKSPRKIYAIDTGLAHAVGFEASENLGHHAENAVAVELARRCARATAQSVWYFKDAQHREVDFVIQNGREVRTLIQVVWDVSAHLTKEREIKSLAKAMGEFKDAEALILTAKDKGEELILGRRARYVPLDNWLNNQSIS